MEQYLASALFIAAVIGINCAFFAWVEFCVKRQWGVFAAVSPLVVTAWLLMSNGDWGPGKSKEVCKCQNSTESANK